MSRIGNKPIVIPEGIEVKIQDSEIIVKGQKGELLTKIVDDRIKFEINEGTLIFSRALCIESAFITVANIPI